ncbi:MAG: hypothetical protein K6E59_02845 [Bacilli bacterium]|nr:hypothetical protein [Bacilli bacterium]
MEQLKPNNKGFDTSEMKKLVQEELEAIRKDPLVYPILSEQLHLTTKEAETYVGALMDLRDDIHYCASCPGLDKCDKPNPHFCLRLEKEGKTLLRHCDPCPKMLSLASFRDRYILCSFDEDWRDADLRDIEHSKSARGKAIVAMVEVAQGKPKWPYFIGNSGSGKTYMLACLANHITKTSGAGAFVNTASLMEDLKDKSIKKKDAFEDLFSRLCKASILVLDDFGNEYKTEYVYTTILFPLLSARDKAGLPTAFASDFTISEIVWMYRGKIGDQRAKQLEGLLVRRCGKEFDVSGVAIH